MWASSDQGRVERGATSPSEAVTEIRATMTLNHEMALNPTDLNLKEPLKPARGHFRIKSRSESFHNRSREPQRWSSMET